ncbi:MAG: hypothetical protein ACKVLC_08215 [Phycisphaerales bacterium]
MANRLHQLVDTVSMWPRAMRWAFCAVVATTTFLIWDATIASLGASWSSQVVTLEQQIAELKKPTTLTSAAKNSVKSFGEVSLPREKTDGASELTNAIHDIFAQYRVKNDEYTRTKTNKMKSGSLPGIASSGETIEQVIGDIQFDATQEDVMKVISALESSPWIDAVSDLRFTRLDGRMIRVDMSVEAWVVSKTQRKGRR